MKVDYNKTMIYKLCCKDINIKDVYVGSTTNFKLRNQDHKNSCNNVNKSYNQYKYKFIRENGGYNNWYMIIVKNFPCNSRRESEQEENKIMIELGATLNSVRPYTTIEERKEEQKECKNNNKEKIIEYNKEYYTENKKLLKEKSKKYQETNKEQIKEQNKKK